MMRSLLAVVLMTLCQVRATAETREAAAKPTVLPRAATSHGRPDKPHQCFVEVGKGVTVTYQPVSVASVNRRNENSVLIACDNATASQAEGKAMSLICTHCKIELGEAVATSPVAIVDHENDRLTLSGTDDNPVVVTFGTGKNAHKASAKEISISLDF